MANIPIVDFDAYSNPDCLHDRVAVAKDIDNAFRSSGFVYLKNHGVFKERVEQCFAWVRYPSSHATASSILRALHVTPPSVKAYSPNLSTEQEVLRPTP